MGCGVTEQRWSTCSGPFADDLGEQPRSLLSQRQDLGADLLWRRQALKLVEVAVEAHLIARLDTLQLIPGVGGRWSTSRRRKASMPHCFAERHLLGVPPVGIGPVLDEQRVCRRWWLRICRVRRRWRCPSVDLLDDRRRRTVIGSSTTLLSSGCPWPSILSESSIPSLWRARISPRRQPLRVDGRPASRAAALRASCAPSRYGPRLPGQVPFDGRSARRRSHRARSSGGAGTSVSGTSSRRARVRFPRPSRKATHSFARRRPVSMP